MVQSLKIEYYMNQNSAERQTEDFNVHKTMQSVRDTITGLVLSRNRLSRIADSAPEHVSDMEVLTAAEELVRATSHLTTYDHVLHVMSSLTSATDNLNPKETEGSATELSRKLASVWSSAVDSDQAVVAGALEVAGQRMEGVMWLHNCLLHELAAGDGGCSPEAQALGQEIVEGYLETMGAGQIEAGLQQHYGTI